MPELPEVETVRRGLALWLPGKEISAIEILHPRAVRRNDGPFLDSIYMRGKKNPLVGSRILNINRRGKFLWFTFDRPFSLVIHLGMSGQVLLPTHDEVNQRTSPHLRARMNFVESERELHFVDQRTFGYLSVEDLVSDPHEGSFLDSSIPKSIEHIAPDLMELFAGSTSMAMDAVKKRIRLSDRAIKRVLLDQEVISGIGNIYADEGLWAAQIHPERIASALTSQKVGRLLICLRDVMESALAAGGTSFDDLYINVNGESGYFDVQLSAYGREDQPCPRCGTLIQRLRFMNRSSHLCPKCQKKG